MTIDMIIGLILLPFVWALIAAANKRHREETGVNGPTRGAMRGIRRNAKKKGISEVCCSGEIVQSMDGESQEGRMFWLLAALLVVGGCAPNQPAAPPPQSFAQSPAGQEARKLIDDQVNCFTREVQSPTVRNVDLDTAALAVQGRCISETMRLKTFSRQHTIETYPQFEARWRETEAKDLLTIKQMLAVIRTSR